MTHLQQQRILHREIAAVSHDPPALWCTTSETSPCRCCKRARTRVSPRSRSCKRARERESQLKAAPGVIHRDCSCERVRESESAHSCSRDSPQGCCSCQPRLADGYRGAAAVSRGDAPADNGWLRGVPPAVAAAVHTPVRLLHRRRRPRRAEQGAPRIVPHTRNVGCPRRRNGECPSRRPASGRAAVSRWRPTLRGFVALPACRTRVSLQLQWSGFSIGIAAVSHKSSTAAGCDSPGVVTVVLLPPAGQKTTTVRAR